MILVPLALENDLSDSKADYSTVVERLESVQAPLSYSWGVVTHLMGVKNSPELRKIHDAVQPSIIEAFQRMGQSVPVYTALKSIREDVVQWSALDTAQRRIVLAALRSMETSGIGLSGEKRTRFNKLKLEAAELSTKFSNNVLDSTKVTHFSNSES